jgi:hypothetical protein
LEAARENFTLKVKCVFITFCYIVFNSSMEFRSRSFECPPAR